MRNVLRLLSLVLVLVMAFPLLAACGNKDEGTAATTAGEDATTTAAPDTTPAPTTTAEPTTEKPTNPPTEPPTDPARPQPDTADILPGMRYYLRSPNSNLYMTVDGDYKYAGFSQQEWTGTPDQMFVFETVDAEAKTYRIRALGTFAAYIDVADGAADNGTLLEATVDPYTPDSQIVKAVKNATKGYYALKTKASNFKGCFDVNGVSKDPGGVIHQWEGGTAQNQVWYLELVAETTTGYVAPETTVAQ